MTKFIEERARMVRSLADKADPFIKRRLLALAERYEAQLALPPKTAPAPHIIPPAPTLMDEQMFTRRASLGPQASVSEVS